MTWSAIHHAQAHRSYRRAGAWLCLNCNRRTCCRCEHPWHPGHTCTVDNRDGLGRQYARRRHEASLSADPLVAATSISCLNQCGAQIEHAHGHGCHHLTCPNCQSEWCQICNTPWHDHGERLCLIYCDTTFFTSAPPLDVDRSVWPRHPTCGCGLCSTCQLNQPCSSCPGCVICNGELHSEWGVILDEVRQSFSISHAQTHTATSAAEAVVGIDTNSTLRDGCTPTSISLATTTTRVSTPSSTVVSRYEMSTASTNNRSPLLPPGLQSDQGHVQRLQGSLT